MRLDKRGEKRIATAGQFMEWIPQWLRERLVRDRRTGELSFNTNDVTTMRFLVSMANDEVGKDSKELAGLYTDAIDELSRSRETYENLLKLVQATQLESLRSLRDTRMAISSEIQTILGGLRELVSFASDQKFAGAVDSIGRLTAALVALQNSAATGLGARLLSAALREPNEP